MKNLVPALKELMLVKHRMKGFHNGCIKIDHYLFGVNIFEDIEDRGEYIVEVGMFNELLDTSRDLVPATLPDTYVILPDIRKKLLETVDKIMVFVKNLAKNGEPIEDLNKYFREVADMQKKVEDVYRHRMMLTKDEVADLHSFFSPGRVVAGLTDAEVRLCIMMYPYRKQQIQLYPGAYPPFLDNSLMNNIDENISRTEGLQKAIYEILIKLANHNPINDS